MKSLSQIDVLNDILKLFLLISVIKYKLILLQYLYHVLHTVYEPFFYSNKYYDSTRKNQFENSTILVMLGCFFPL